MELASLVVVESAHEATFFAPPSLLLLDVRPALTEPSPAPPAQAGLDACPSSATPSCSGWGYGRLFCLPA
jgi:hypothetical protein